VEHRPTGTRAGPPGAVQSQGPSSNFIHDMRSYMPGPHARFLEHVSKISNIRDFVLRNKYERGLEIAYDACLAMVRTFRDKHMQMVSRYIIIKSRESRSDLSSTTSSSTTTTATTQSQPPKRGEKVNLASAKTADGAEKKGLRGTGGTALIPFLKQARDETGEPAIDAWARRLLSNGPGFEGVRMGKLGEKGSGEHEVLGLAGVWSVDDSDGGICHW